MGRKRSGKEPRGSGSRRKKSGRDPRGAEAGQNRPGVDVGASGSSRLLLTRLLREGALWEVYVAAAARPGAPNQIHLEFEGKGPARQRLRYTRPVEGPLLEALHSGAPVSRARLEEELELACRADDAGARAESDPTDEQ